MNTSQIAGVSPIPVYAEIPLNRLNAVDESYTQLLNCTLKPNTELRLSRSNKFYTVRAGASGMVAKCIQKIVNLFAHLRHGGFSRKSSDKLSKHIIEILTIKTQQILNKGLTNRVQSLRDAYEIDKIISYIRKTKQLKEKELTEIETINNLIKTMSVEG
jgi:hypothetical protein